MTDYYYISGRLLTKKPKYPQVNKKDALWVLVEFCDSALYREIREQFSGIENFDNVFIPDNPGLKLRKDLGMKKCDRCGKEFRFEDMFSIDDWLLCECCLEQYQNQYLVECAGCARDMEEDEAMNICDDCYAEGRCMICGTKDMVEGREVCFQCEMDEIEGLRS